MARRKAFGCWSSAQWRLRDPLQLVSNRSPPFAAPNHNFLCPAHVHFPKGNQASDPIKRHPAHFKALTSHPRLCVIPIPLHSVSVKIRKIPESSSWKYL